MEEALENRLEVGPPIGHPIGLRRLMEKAKERKASETTNGRQSP